MWYRDSTACDNGENVTHVWLKCSAHHWTVTRWESSKEHHLIVQCWARREKIKLSKGFWMQILEAVKKFDWSVFVCIVFLSVYESTIISGVRRHSGRRSRGAAAAEPRCRCAPAQTCTFLLHFYLGQVQRRSWIFMQLLVTALRPGQRGRIQHTKQTSWAHRVESFTDCWISIQWNGTKNFVIENLICIWLDFNYFP